MTPSGTDRPAREGLLERLKKSPCDLSLWRELRQTVQEQGDAFSAKSLKVIVEGLEQLATAAGGRSLEELTGLQRAAFGRLAQAYNNPRLLQEIGVLYLGELRLPRSAWSHFELAQALGGDSRELQELIEIARRAAETPLQARPAHELVEKPKFVGPDVSSLARRTGKLMLEARGTGRLPPVAPPEKTEAAAAAADPAALDVALGQAPPGEGWQALPPASERPKCLQDTASLKNVLYVDVPEDELASLTRAVAGKASLGKDDEAWKTAQEFCGNRMPPEAAWQVWTELGTAWYARGAYGQAARAFAKARDLQPEEMVSWYNLGLACQHDGKNQDALHAFVCADRCSPDHPHVWTNMSELYFQAEIFDDALSAAQKAVQNGAEYAKAWNALGAALSALDRLPEAADACRRAVQLDGSLTEAWFRLGMLYFHENLLDEAENAFRRARNLTATSAYALCYLALICARRQDLAAAREFAERAEALDRRCEVLGMAWREVSAALLIAGEAPEAVAACKKALAHDPQSPDCWHQMGLCYERTGQFPDARRCFREAVNLDDGHTEAWKGLGAAACETRDFEAAADAFQQAVDLDPHDAASWHNLGTCLENLGLVQEARDAYHAASRLEREAERTGSLVGRALRFLWKKES